MSNIKAFFLGMREFRSGFTTSFADNDMQDSYDWGREWAHRLTLRRYDQ